MALSTQLTGAASPVRRWRRSTWYIIGAIIILILVDGLVALTGVGVLVLEFRFIDGLYNQSMLNAPAPDFTLPTLASEPITLKALRGKPVVLNFWATWCPPCQQEIPVLEAGYSRHRTEVQFLAINLGEEQATVQEFARTRGMWLPILLDPYGKVGSRELYGILGMPTTIFIDADGLIVKRHLGPLDEATLERYLAELKK